MLLTAQRTPHPSPDLGQAVDAVRLDPRGNFTTRARAPHHLPACLRSEAARGSGSSIASSQPTFRSSRIASDRMSSWTGSPPFTDHSDRRKPPPIPERFARPFRDNSAHRINSPPFAPRVQAVLQLIASWGMTRFTGLPASSITLCIAADGTSLWKRGRTGDTLRYHLSVQWGSFPIGKDA